MLPNLQETADLVTFTEKIFHGKLHFLCSVSRNKQIQIMRLQIFKTRHTVCEILGPHCRKKCILNRICKT